jgi:hypothetical protein
MAARLRETLSRFKLYFEMRDAEQNLAAALRERIAIIGDEESRRDQVRHMERLRAISERIDTLASSLPQPVDPRLAHFLERRSYDKALEMLG